MQLKNAEFYMGNEDLLGIIIRTRLNFLEIFFNSSKLRIYPCKTSVTSEILLCKLAYKLKRYAKFEDLSVLKQMCAF